MFSNSFLMYCSLLGHPSVHSWPLRISSLWTNTKCTAPAPTPPRHRTRGTDHPLLDLPLPDLPLPDLPPRPSLSCLPAFPFSSRQNCSPSHRSGASEPPALLWRLFFKFHCWFSLTHFSLPTRLEPSWRSHDGLLLALICNPACSPDLLMLRHRSSHCSGSSFPTELIPSSLPNAKGLLWSGPCNLSSHEAHSSLLWAPVICNKKYMYTWSSLAELEF